MKPLKNQLVFIWVVVLLMCSGCGHFFKPPRTAVPGDTVTFVYTCRTPDGAVISTVDEKTATNPKVAKSSVFLAPETTAPVTVIADAHASSDIEDPFGGFDGLLRAKLAEKVIGLKEKEQVTMLVEAHSFDTLKPADRFLSMARVRTRPKEKVMPMDRFLRFSKKKPPVTGMVVTLDPGFLGKVRDVKEDRVYMDVLVDGDDGFHTLMGKANIVDTGDHYEVTVNAQKGDMVRLANMVGVISNITGDTVEMDFAHPFGGRPLACEVTVQAVAAPEMPDTNSAMEKIGKALSDAEAHGLTDVTIDLSEDPERVQPGDLVDVSAAVYDAEGALLFSTNEEDMSRIVDDSPLSDNALVFRKAGKPLRFLLGMDAPVKGIQTVVTGLKPGTKQTMTVPPEEAYGLVNPSEIKNFPRTKSMPRRISMTAEEFIENTGTFPVLDHEVTLNPYVEGKVIETSEEKVVVAFFAEDGKRISDELGTTTIRVYDDKISLALTPKINAWFQVGEKRGRVVSMNDHQFSVDFNHPLAGKPLTFDVSVRSLTKASRLYTQKIDWIEDFDFGQTVAKDNEKPMVLVLYASWCAWSHRFFDEVMTDPKIKSIDDRFVWVRVDSDKETMVKDMFEQESFPMIVVIGSNGEIIKKLKGFRTADTFRKELMQCVDNQTDTQA